MVDNESNTPKAADTARNATISHGRTGGRGPAAGPLVVSTRNPRYFTVESDADQQAVYLTGSHIWNNFHDGMGPGPACAETPEQFDFDAYLAFLKTHGHNFIRLWRWEQVTSQAAGGKTVALSPG